MEATTANEHANLENAEVEVVAGIPAFERLGDERLAVIESERLERGPRHPRPKVVDAGQDRLVEKFGIARRVSTDDEPPPEYLDGRTGDAHVVHRAAGFQRAPFELGHRRRAPNRG